MSAALPGWSGQDSQRGWEGLKAGTPEQVRPEQNSRNRQTLQDVTGCG